ncbi:ABC transporter permease [Streptomyces halstedii]|uniref:ABC transporter permease n=1 Tax=Streptomyces TaxID=1883 RepID=UPI00048FFEA0|nr:MULTISPECIES: ABC transporter permease [unclassified Streptomyces]MYR70702.1 ABC transporter permease subunit [Streptomyces sp. SID4925]MYY20047.1 ABC transporter permease subunit [Streptomyces sp. SID4912]SBU97515.1 ABC-type nitrate/sulfonate/bicarbonate transport system, permease component [Streptomyces sp. OspMP-M45]SCD58487.1 ABC-type nitrate/sulfonate/bicarbonate transport system, permease component [Streptomyces sp. PpalLS-921]SCE31575.1 ABC-type nitrate/sulfonate/bicarbonate transpor
MSTQRTAARVGRRLVMALGLPIVLFVLWWVLSADSTSFYMPPLADILSEFRELWLGSAVGSDVVPSLTRLAIGFAVAVVGGVGLGVLLGSVEVLRRAFEPLLEFFRAVPAPVLVPVLMLFAGIGDTMKVLVIASGCIWPILLNSVEGVRSIDPVMLDVCRSYRVGGAARMRHLVLRSASPQIMAGIRQSLSIGLILVVISEMFAPTNGLGFSIVTFQRQFAIPEMWSGIVLLGLIGFVLAMIFAVIERRVLRWYFGLRDARKKG